MGESLFDRVQPHSLEAERAVLGACLLDRDALLSATEILEPEDFYDLHHRDFFALVEDMARKDLPVDPLTLWEEISRHPGMGERLGGQGFLAAVVDSVPTTANVEWHARIIRSKALRRRLIAAGGLISRLGFAEDREMEDVLDEAERLVFDIAQRGNDRPFRHVREIVPEAFQHIEKAFFRKDQTIGTPSGFVDFDHLGGGLQPGNLIIVAARPSMGKTALALNMAQYAAIKEKKSVLIFSLEMGGEQLVQRLLGAEAQINIHDLRTGNFAKEQWERLAHAAGRISTAPIYIDDSSDLSTLDLRARARRFVALMKGQSIGLVVVDYLQLMRCPRSSESRQQEVAEISRALKAVARELSVPVVALSQLSRAVESRTDRRPMLSDLRDSGAIEQDADMVLLLYRPGYYDRKDGDDEDPRAEVIVAKHRNGPTGTVNLIFRKEFAQFVNSERQRY